MIYCSGCGKKFSDDVKFCPYCGRTLDKTKEDYIRKEVFVGKVFKCPNCGAAIKKQEAICPECGFHLNKKEVPYSVEQFAKKLYDIENKFSISIPIFSQGFGDSKFRKKLSLISSFPIPNTVEEITEFLILASNSIDDKFGKKGIANGVLGIPGTLFYSEIKLNQTWVRKMEQVYQKAQLSFGDFPEFEKIKNIYETKMKKLNRLK